MGDPRKNHKQFKRPRTPFDKNRISEEKSFVNKFGLKNKKEIWHSEGYIDKIRAQAKKLIIHPEEQEIFFNRLAKLGLIKSGATIDDVLDLTKEKLFERRLQTIVFKKKLAKSLRESRQLIVHKKIKIANRIMNVPSYIVRIEEENKISVVKKQKKKKATEKIMEQSTEQSAKQPEQSIKQPEQLKQSEPQKIQEEKQEKK